MTQQKIDISLIEQRFIRTQDYANKNMMVIQHREAKLFDALPLVLDSILKVNARAVVKRNKLRDVALELNEKLKPYVACKPDCSHCCNIPVVITDYEAKRISEATKTPYVERPEGFITPRDMIKDDVADDFYRKNQSKYDRKPCPFLKENACSIYDHRPMSCITHHSLDESNFFCQSSIPSELSSVPSINFHYLHQFNAAIDLDFYMADIRDFFPNA